MSAIDFIFSFLRCLVQIATLARAVHEIKRLEPPLVTRHARDFLELLRRNPLVVVDEMEKAKERKWARLFGTATAVFCVVVLEVFHLLGIYYQVLPEGMSWRVQIFFYVATFWAIYEVEHS